MRNSVSWWSSSTRSPSTGSEPSRSRLRTALGPQRWGERFVPEDVAQARLEKVIELQRAVSAERLALQVGRDHLAMVDEVADPDDPVVASLYADPGGGPDTFHLGRIASQADDIDGSTVLVGGERLAAGTLVRVRIDRAEDFDLGGPVGEVVRPASRRAEPPVPQAGRRLPILGLESAWGR